MTARRPTIWLARHAPVSTTGVCYGQSNVPTSFSPSDAAETIRRHQDAAGNRCSEVWCSPWDRTLLVAEALARSWNLPLRVDARLSELSFGAWEGRTYAEIERDDGEQFARWMREYQTCAPPNGETLAELRARVAAWLLERDLAGRQVLAVTHAGVIRIARVLRRGLRVDQVIGEPVNHLQPEQV